VSQYQKKHSPTHAYSDHQEKGKNDVVKCILGPDVTLQSSHHETKSRVSSHLALPHIYFSSYFAPRRGGKYCLSAHITQKLHNRTSPNFLCMLPVAVAWPSSDGIVICYVLPVLRMMSCFHTMTTMGRIKHEIKFRRVCQVVVPVGRQTTTVYSVWLSSSQCGTSSKVCYLQLPCHICQGYTVFTFVCLSVRTARVM